VRRSDGVVGYAMSHMIEEAIRLGGRPLCPIHGASQTQGVKDPTIWGHLWQNEEHGEHWCVGRITKEEQTA
jgi:hypothetical protein